MNFMDNVQRTGRSRTVTSLMAQRVGIVAVAALAVALSAIPAAAVELKPGDIVVGTGANSDYGAGGLFVVDPFAQTVTPIGSQDYFNGIGGLAIDSDFNVVVGTMTNTAGGAGQVFVVEPSAETSTRLSPFNFYDGIGALTLDADGNVIVGTAASSQYGGGQLFSIDPSDPNNPTNLNPSQFYVNGVTAVGINAAGDYVVGTGTNQELGLGYLYSVDSSTGAATMIGETGHLAGIGGLVVESDGNVVYGNYANQTAGFGNLFRVGPGDPAPAPVQVGSDDYYTGIGALGTDLDGNLYVGTTSNTEFGAGLLYMVNSATGERMDPITGAPADAPIVNHNFYNGISAVAVVGPQVDFTGGLDITISADDTADVDGSPDFFSRALGANVKVGDLQTLMAAGPASVRPGTAYTGNQDGDLTLAVALDYNTASGNTQELTLRASDDIFLQQSITDSDGTSTDALNLSLYATNARQWPGLHSGGPTGVVNIDAEINLGGGDLYASGITFDNADNTGTITTGNTTLEFTGDVVVTTAIDTGNLTVAAGNFSNDIGFTATAGTELTDLSLTLSKTAGTGFDASADIDAAIEAESFTAAAGLDEGGTPIADIGLQNDATITVSSGNMDLSGLTGDVQFNEAVDVQTGNLAVGNANTAAASLTTQASGTVGVAGDVDVFTSGAVSIGAAMTANSLDVDAGSFTNTADVDTTLATGPIALSVTGDVLVDALLKGTGISSQGVGFTATSDATIETTTGDLDLSGHTGDVALDGAVTVAGSLLSGSTGAEAGAFTSGSGGALDVTGDITLRHQGNITVGAGVDAANVDLSTIGADAASGTVAVNAALGHLAKLASLSIDGFDVTTGAAGNLNVDGAIGITADNDISLAAPVDAGSMTSSGLGFATNNAATITTQSGDLDLSAHTEAVSLDAAVTVAGNLLSGTSGQRAGDFTTGPVSTTAATLDVAGDISLLHSGDVTFNATVDAANVGIDTTDGDVLINQAFGAGGTSTLADLTVVADNLTTADTSGTLTATGLIDVTVDANVALNAAVDAGSFTSVGAGFTTGVNAAVVTQVGDLNLSGHTGAVSLDAPVTVTGDLTSGQQGAEATTFQTGAAAALDVAGDLTLRHQGNVTVGAKVDATNVDISTIGADAATGTVAINETVGDAANVASLTVDAYNLTSGADGDLNVDGAVHITLDNNAQLGAAVDAGSLTSRGNDFATDSTATIDTQTGDVDLSAHTGAVSLDAAVTVAGNMTSGSDVSRATTFATGPVSGTAATLDVAGDLTLRQSGNVTLGAAVDAANIDIDTSDGDVNVSQTLGTGSGASTLADVSVVADNFTTAATNGAINATGAINLAMDQAVGINAAVDTGSLASSGVSFTTGLGGTLLAQAGNIDLTGHTGALSFDASVDVQAGDLLTAGTALTTGSSAPVAVSGGIVATQDGMVTLQSDVQATNMTVYHGGFDNTGGALNVAGDITIEDFNLKPLGPTSAQQYDVLIGSNATSTNFHSSGVNFDSRPATTTVAQAMTLNHTGRVDLGDTAATSLDLGPAAQVYVGTDSTPYTVDVDTIDLSGVGYMEVKLDSVLDVDGEFRQTDPTVVTLAGGTIRTSSLQTWGDLDNSFNFFFGEMHIDKSDAGTGGNLVINNLGAAERVLGADPEVFYAQTLRVDGNTTLQEAFEINGGSFITGTLTNAPLLRFNAGSFSLTEEDMVIGYAGQFGATYDLGFGRKLNLVDGPTANSVGRITVAPEGLLRMSGGEAYTDGGTLNQGTIIMDSSVSRLGGATVTNAGVGSLIYGTGIVEGTLVNNTGAVVQASLGERLTFSGVDNVNHGTIGAYNNGTIAFTEAVTNSSDGVMTGNSGVFNFGKVTSYSVPNFDGTHLTNEGKMQFVGSSTITGDIVAKNSSNVTVAGTSSLVIFGDVYSLGATAKASNEASEIVYFGMVRGLLNTTGSGDHIFEGGTGGFSPGWMGGSGNVTWQDGVMVEVDIDGTLAQTQENYNAYFGDFDPQRLEGRYQVYDYGGTLTIRDGANIIVDVWDDDQNNTIYECQLGDTFVPVRYGSLTLDGELDITAITLDLPELSNPAWSWDAKWTGGESQAGALTLTVVPEPGSFLLALIGLLGLFGFGLTGRRCRSRRGYKR